MGRKPVATPAEVAVYATSMVTQAELAELLGITQQAVSQMLQKPAYRDAWENARASTRYKLRKAQIEKALDGDKVMQIWTGKQYLEQRDSPKEIDVKSDVQVTYIARWGGQPGGELPPAEDTLLVEGEAEEEE